MTNNPWNTEPFNNNKMLTYVPPFITSKRTSLDFKVLFHLFVF